MAGLIVFRSPCQKCCGQNGVHYLTCPLLNLPPGGSETWTPAGDDRGSRTG